MINWKYLNFGRTSVKVSQMMSSLCISFQSGEICGSAEQLVVLRQNSIKDDGIIESFFSTYEPEIDKQRLILSMEIFSSSQLEITNRARGKSFSLRSKIPGEF
jgi:hypothetical protein